MKKILFALLLGVLFVPLRSWAMNTEVTLILLAEEESGTQDNIRVLDVNNKYSYGRLQFQLGTFMQYGKLYGILPDELTEAEGRLLIHNPKVQKAIARLMIENGLACKPVGWYNSCKKLGII